MSPKISINNVDIITLDDDATIHRNSTLTIEDGIIVQVGHSSSDFKVDEAVDGDGKVAMPGLVNAHCHSPMNMVRGWAEDLPFVDWLESIWVPESGLPPDDVYWGASLAAAEMIRSGTVA